MLIGLNPKSPTPKSAASNDNIYDVTTQEFETKILAESQKRPVIIDFWAPWCGPCKQLMPVMEEVVGAKDGKVALAKVNIDDNPELAQAFRVQSVPMIVAFYQGQAVAGFAGARPKSEIDKLVTQLVEMHRQQQPDTLDVPAALKEAAHFMAEENFSEAEQIYGAVLAQDNMNTQAIAGLMRVLMATDGLEQAKLMNLSVPDQITKDPYIISVRTALELAQNTPRSDIQGIEAKLKAEPENPELLFNYAEACFAAGQKDKAVDALVTIIRTNRAWEDDKPRQQLLKYFEAWGHMDPASVSGQRKLSSLLFS